jgi:hypothetical protein
MDERVYDVQTVSSVSNKAKESLLEDKGMDATSRKANQLVEFCMTNPYTNAVLLHLYVGE